VGRGRGRGGCTCTQDIKRQTYYILSTKEANREILSCLL
jgi:hypothetical protein